MNIYNFPHLYEIAFRNIPPLCIWRREWEREVYRFLVSLPNPPSSIVDLCCGTGFLFPMIKRIYPNSKIIGVDISESMIKFAHKHYPFVEFRCSNITSITNKFEVIIMGGGLTTIPINVATDSIKRISPRHFILSGYRLSLWSLMHSFFVKTVMGIRCHIISPSKVIETFKSRGMDVSIRSIDRIEGSYAIYNGTQ